MGWASSNLVSVLQDGSLLASANGGTGRRLRLAREKGLSSSCWLPVNPTWMLPYLTMQALSRVTIVSSCSCCNTTQTASWSSSKTWAPVGQSALWSPVWIFTARPQVQRLACSLLFTWLRHPLQALRFWWLWPVPLLPDLRAVTTSCRCWLLPWHRRFSFCLSATWLIIL